MATVLEKRIKKLLDDITDLAMKNEPEAVVKRYKDYDLFIVNKEFSSFAGRWFGPRIDDKDKTKYRRPYIEVYNLSRGASETAGTLLHELSHQVDYVRHGDTGHQKPFYEAYAQLIYASLDLGILSRKDYESLEWGSDKNKVMAIVNRYEPHPVKYSMNDVMIIKAYNCYDQKEELKKRGYGWNAIELSWEKEAEDLEAEERYLRGLGAIRVNAGVKEKRFHYTTEKYSMYVDAIAYIEAIGETYAKKEDLKKRGFVFNQARKSWVLRTKTSVVKKMMEELSSDANYEGIIFKTMKVNK